MSIQLSKELEQFVHDAVRAGLYARDEDVITDALTRLKQAVPEAAQKPTKSARRAKAKPTTPAPKKPMTEEEFHRHLMEIGLISQLPDTDADYDDPDDEPIPIKGEPLSETVIRERR
jgi:Arc/MetJ-type ribon-helix-helix transcriptional regulator